MKLSLTLVDRNDLLRFLTACRGGLVSFVSEALFRLSGTAHGTVATASAIPECAKTQTTEQRRETSEQRKGIFALGNQ